MNGKSKITTDHNEIRKWIEERDGRPVSVRGTGSPEDPGLLRIDFLDKQKAGGADENLIELSWEEFFDKFEEKELAFLYQNETREGKPSRFFKFVERPGKENPKNAQKN